MYLDIGGETLLKSDSILGVFDLDNTTVNKATREYLNTAEKEGYSKTVSYDLPKSFLVTIENNSPYVYISPLLTGTIYKRLKPQKLGEKSNLEEQYGKRRNENK